MRRQVPEAGCPLAVDTQAQGLRRGTRQDSWKLFRRDRVLHEYAQHMRISIHKSRTLRGGGMHILWGADMKRLLMSMRKVGSILQAETAP